MLRHLCQRAWPVLLIFGLDAGLGAGLGSAGCSNTGGLATVSVDRSNPDSVIRAYFDAWQRGDWTVQAALMDKKYQGMVPEPVESIRVLTIRPLGGSSATRREYVVSFEIKVKGQAVSMESGHYDWSYELTWDKQRRSWLITNYGAG